MQNRESGLKSSMVEISKQVQGIPHTSTSFNCQHLARENLNSESEDLVPEITCSPWTQSWGHHGRGSQSRRWTVCLWTSLRPFEGGLVSLVPEEGGWTAIPLGRRIFKIWG